MTGWEYICPNCGARISSGWADPVCPIPNCGSLLNLISGPKPSDSDVQEIIEEAERILGDEKSS